MIRCAIYLRQSLDLAGDGLAVTRQREDCRKIAADRGWTIVGEYIDNSISASDRRKHRPGYDQLVTAYENGEFAAVVCWDLDRLTRQPRQLEDWIEAAEERGLLLVTANGEADLSTDGGRLFARMKAAVARAEVERKSARQRRAALQRSEQGKPPLGVRLTGYTPAGDLVPDEAAAIAGMFARFAAGDSLRSIAAWLDTTGVPTRRGGKWNPSSVRTVLTNPRYAGRAVYQGKPTGKRGGWLSIVDDTTFDLVQARLSDPRRRTQQGTDRRHLGAGLYLCGACGERVRSWSGDRYRCPAACITRARDPIDEYVVDVVRARLRRDDIQALVSAEDDGEVAEMVAEVARLRGRLEAIEADYDAGLIDGRRFATATEKVHAELTAAERELSRVSSSGAADGVLRAPDPVRAFDVAPLMIRRGVLDALYVVRLGPAPRGRRGLDVSTVEVIPRAGGEGENGSSERENYVM